MNILEAILRNGRLYQKNGQVFKLGTCEYLGTVKEIFDKSTKKKGRP